MAKRVGETDKDAVNRWKHWLSLWIRGMNFVEIANETGYHKTTIRQGIYKYRDLQKIYKNI